MERRVVRIWSQPARERVFALCYRAYRHANLIDSIGDQKFSDPWDEGEKHIIWAVTEDDQVVASLRTTWGGDIPEAIAFGDLIETLPCAGGFVSANRLVVDPARRTRRIEYILILLRLHLMAAKDLAKTAICAVREKHVPFYERLTGMRRVGASRVYPHLNCEMFLLWGDYEANIKAVQSANIRLAPVAAELLLLSQAEKKKWERGVPA